MSHPRPTGSARIVSSSRHALRGAGGELHRAGGGEVTLRRGNLWTTPFVELLRLALAQGATGRMELAGEQVRRRVWWVDGLPVAGRSNLLSENLLRLLLRRGLLDRTTYTELLGGGGEVSAEALGACGVPSEALAEAEQALVEEILLGCLSWTEAEYTFEAVAAGDQVRVQRFDPVALYMRWLREQVAVDRVLAEALRYRERAVVLSASGHLHGVLVESGVAASPLLRRALRSGETLGRTLEQAGEGLDEVVRGFTALLHLGLIVMGGSDGQATARGRSAMTASQDRLVAVRRTGGHGALGLEQAQGEVRAALERARVAESPREVFGLPENADAQEAQEIYRALEERYRLDRFRALGDEGLLASLSELRERLDGALQALMKTPPLSRPLPRSLPAMRARRLTETGGGPGGRSEDAALLAQLLFSEGKTYLRLGDFEEAADHFRQAHIHGASEPAYLGWYGWALTLSHPDASEPRYRQGREALVESLRRSNAMDDVWVLLGNVLSQEGDGTRSASAYRRALELNPGNREARMALELLG